MCSGSQFWKDWINDASSSREFGNVVRKLQRKQKDHRVGPLADDDQNMFLDELNANLFLEALILTRET